MEPQIPASIETSWFEAFPFSNHIGKIYLGRKTQQCAAMLWDRKTVSVAEKPREAAAGLLIDASGSQKEWKGGYFSA